MNQQSTPSPSEMATLENPDTAELQQENIANVGTVKDETLVEKGYTAHESEAGAVNPNAQNPEFRPRVSFLMAGIESQVPTDIDISALSAEQAEEILANMSEYSTEQVTSLLENFSSTMSDIGVKALLKDESNPKTVELLNLILSKEGVDQTSSNDVSLPQQTESAESKKEAVETPQKSKIETFLQQFEGDSLADKYINSKQSSSEELTRFWDSITDPEEETTLKEEIIDSIVQDYVENTKNGEEDPELRSQIENLVDELGAEVIKKKEKHWGETLSGLIKTGMEGGDMDLFIQALILGNTSGGTLARKFSGFGKEGEQNRNEVGIAEYKQFVGWKDTDSRDKKMQRWINPMILFLQDIQAIDSSQKTFKDEDFPTIDDLKKIMKTVYEQFAKKELQEINDSFKKVSESKDSSIEFNWKNNSSIGQEMAIMIELLSKHNSAINGLFGSEQPSQVDT